MELAELEALVTALDAIDAHDPEKAHYIADKLVLDSLSPEVRDAYQRLVDRAEWWATA